MITALVSPSRSPRVTRRMQQISRKASFTSPSPSASTFAFYALASVSPAENPPERERDGVHQHEAIKVVRDAPEVSRDRAVMDRAPEPESRDINRHHLGHRAEDMRDGEDDRGEQKSDDVAVRERPLADGEERGEEDEVEGEIAQRNRRPLRSRIEVGAVDGHVLIVGRT